MFWIVCLWVSYIVRIGDKRRMVYVGVWILVVFGLGMLVGNLGMYVGWFFVVIVKLWKMIGLVDFGGL